MLAGRSDLFAEIVLDRERGAGDGRARIRGNDTHQHLVRLTRARRGEGRGRCEDQAEELRKEV